MYHKRVKDICCIAMVILIFSALGCGKREKEIHQEKPLDSKAVVPSQELASSGSKEVAEKIKTGMEPAGQETETIKVTFIELGSVKCIPCKMMQPIMEEIEEEYKGQVEIIFYDVRTAEGEPYAQKYDVRVIPTQIFLDKDGNEYSRHEGFLPKDELVKVLKEQGVK